MPRVYNFSPGPATLPDEVLADVQQAIYDYADAGAGIAELSHRGRHFTAVRDDAEALLRELLAIPDSYAVLFLTGGASMQGAAIPLNLLPDENARAAYIITGRWSQRSQQEARRFCQTHIAADTSDSNFTTLPTQLDIPADCGYCFYVDNETVHGVEFPAPLPTPPGVPRVVDMTSNFLSRPINIEDYGLIYAGTQKQFGIAGITVVVVRRALIRPRPQTPSVVDYAKQDAAGSLYNTPPVLSIYAMRQCLRWLTKQGGVAWAAEQSHIKSQRLYAAVDALPLYRAAVQDSDVRSRMNIPFFLPNDEMSAAFLRTAEDAGLFYLRGHKTLGGCRASMYNHLPLAAVTALTAHMQTFAQTHH